MEMNFNTTDLPVLEAWVNKKRVYEQLNHAWMDVFV